MTKQLPLGLPGPLVDGLQQLPWPSTPLAGALAGRIGTRLLLATGLALQSAGLAGFVVIASVAGAQHDRHRATHRHGSSGTDHSEGSPLPCTGS